MRVHRFISLAFCAVLILPTARISRAQDAASAKSFIKSIFKLYENHGNGTTYSSLYFHSSLLSLIRADLKAENAASEVAEALDADIVWSCQDWGGGIRVRTMDVRLMKPGRALAVVTFLIGPPGNGSESNLYRMQYTLVAERGQWRIYDIEDLSPALEPTEPRSLRKQIQKDIEDFAHPPEP
jgi:hypothetical protein